MTWDIIIGGLGFALIIGAATVAPRVRDRLAKERAARQWLTNRERGDKP